MKTRLLLPIVFFAPTLIVSQALGAQEHKITIKPSVEGTRFTVESASKVESATKVLMNGEERQVGGGGGGGRAAGGRGGAPQGPVSTSEKVVFVDGGTWRQYDVAEAKVTLPGWDGENSEQAVTGELNGQKISLGAEPAVLGDGDKATPLSARAARGIPKKIDLSGLAPKSSLKIEGTYEVAGFHQALGSLVHPVRARVERPEGGGEAAAGGRRGRRGEGAEGAEGGAGDQGGRAQGGRAQGRGQGRGGMGARENPVLRVLAAEGIQSKVSGKLTKVENNIATITLTGTVSGKGDPAKLGVDGGMGGFGGRGGRGGQGGDAGNAPQAESEGSVTVEITGTLVIDLATSAVASLSISGDMQSKVNSVSSMDRGGETMEIERDTTQKGSFSLKVTCAPSK